MTGMARVRNADSVCINKVTASGQTQAWRAAAVIPG
jgi:hypothetical protein